MQCITEIPYTDLNNQHAAIKNELVSAMTEVLDSGKFVLGPQVAEFEKAFAKLCGTKYAVGVNSGTDALILALRALNIGEGDEVITAPNGFVSSVSAIVQVGAKPVFIDVGNDYNINPEGIEAAITENTKGILPVHLTGRPAQIEQIIKIANKHNLVIVEDAAQAVEASLGNKKVGSFGNIGAFSLHPLKTLNACGDGGVLTTDDVDLYEKLLVLRNNGFQNRNECAVFSINSRLDSMQAAFLLVKLKYLNEWTKKKQHIAHLYREKLQNVSQVTYPIDAQGIKCVYHTFVIRVKDRDGLQNYLKQNGIKTKIHYPVATHLQPAARSLGCKKGDFPNAEKQAEEILSLPIFPDLSVEQIDYIVQCIKQFYQKEG